MPGTSFTPTSQKFLQWRDPNTKIVYGLGFGSEEEMKVFGEKFNEALAGTLLATEAAAAQAQPAAAKPVSAPAVARKEAQAQPAAAKPTEAAAVPASRAQAPSEPDAGAAAATPSTRDEPAHQPPRQAAGSTASGSTPAGEAAADAHGTGAVQDKDMATLRFQNERLREALKQSSENRAQWEQELQTARNHNARLKTALQDSFKNMEEWKKQLAVWQAEAAKAKARVKEVEEEHLQKGEGALAKQQAMEEDMATKRVEMEALAGRLKESDRDKERLAARNKELEAKVADLEKAKEVSCGEAPGARVTRGIAISIRRERPLSPPPPPPKTHTAWRPSVVARIHPSGTVSLTSRVLPPSAPSCRSVRR